MDRGSVSVCPCPCKSHEQAHTNAQPTHNTHLARWRLARCGPTLPSPPHHPTALSRYSRVKYRYGPALSRHIATMHM
eukprot:scaffold41831_cov73-Phaeocystis_antarctica.AAC.3